MKSALLYLWQLPQNILGIAVIIFTKARYNDISDDKSENYWLTKKFRFGVSLGNYIIFGNIRVTPNTLNHEKGHQKQSLYLGPLYLILIGIPSFCGNIYDRIFHRKWDNRKRVRWYYGQPWEAWADRLGNVKR